jgi:hypothetical protein
MEAPEQFFGDRRVGPALADGRLERQQSAADHGQVLVAFREVVGEEAVDEVGHRRASVPESRSSRACVNSAFGANGLSCTRSRPPAAPPIALRHRRAW